MSLKNKKPVASFRHKNKLNLFHILTFLICGFLCLGAPAAPASAATLESLPMASYISFGGRTWQKARFYNQNTWDSTAQTYLIMTSDYTNSVFDNRSNTCWSPAQPYGYNDFNSSNTIKSLLNTTFYNTLTNNSWIINKNFYTTDDANGNYLPKVPGNECSVVNTGTGATYVTTKIALPSYAEYNGNPSGLATYCTTSWCWLRTPGSDYSSGNVVRIVNSGGSFSAEYAVDTYGVRPALHLQSGLLTQSGNGTESNPYILGETDPSFCLQPENANSLGCLPMGAVIQITPATTGMCSDTNCSGITGTTLPYKLIKMNAANSGDAYFMLADNYCWWGSADCKSSGGTKNAYGSTWNASSTADFSNTISTLKAYNVTTQLRNFYNSLPVNIGGITKITAIPTKVYDMYPIAITSGTGATTQGACNLSTTADFNATNCNWNTQITLPSYVEWQGGLYAYGRYPTSGQAGEEYCKARFGVSCSNAGSYGLFSSSGSNTNPSPYYPWFRSSHSGDSANVWSVDSGWVTNSASITAAYAQYGISPAFNITSSISTCGLGAGTYASPYLIDGCNTPPNISLTSASADTSLNSSGVFNLSGFVGDADIGQSLTVTATLSGIAKTQVISGGAAAIVDEEFLLSWSAGELGDGFVLNGSSDPIVVTVTDDSVTPASATANFTGNINVNFANAQNEQPLNNIPSGSIVYFGGRRFVKISNQVTGESYLWQASDEQQQPWHAIASSWNNTTTDFYSNFTKLGYWLTNTYTNLLNAAQPTAGSWINSSNWTMGNETNESATTVAGKINLPSYSEWTANKSNYCLAAYGAQCDSNMVLPFIFWLRTPYSSYALNTWNVSTSGTSSDNTTSRSYGVRPALNLISTIQACGSGDGSYENPYFLGNGNCTATNQPTITTADMIESFPAGTVIQMDDYKFIKMSDYLEPQRLSTTGTTSNRYFVMADQLPTTSAWDPDDTNGCVGGDSGVCGQPGGWTDTSNANHIKNTLNTTFYNTLTTNMQNMIADTAWPVGGTGDHAAENNEFVRTDTSKIALISNREWLQHGVDYCKSRQNKAARNCNIGSFTTIWWNRTPISSVTYSTWVVITSGTFNNYYSTVNKFGVRPALNLVSGISPSCGSGTYADPYFLTPEACNTPPVITLDNPTFDQQLSVSGNVTFTGSLSDVDVGQQLNLKVQVMADDGVTPLYSKDYPISPLSPVNQSWSVSLNYLDLINLGERFNKVKFILSDGISNGNVEVDYTGIITLESLQGKVDELYKLLGVNLAGQIYYPMTSKMANVGDTYDGYTLLSNIDFSHQLWTQTLNSHPDMLSQTNQNNEQATPSSQVNTYLVKFFQPVQNLGTMSLSP